MNAPSAGNVGLEGIRQLLLRGCLRDWSELFRAFVLVAAIN